MEALITQDRVQTRVIGSLRDCVLGEALIAQDRFQERGIDSCVLVSGLTLIADEIVSGLSIDS